jgi:hypothetical protein
MFKIWIINLVGIILFFVNNYFTYDFFQGPGQYNLNSFLSELNDSAHYKNGKFGKIDQYPAVSGDRLSVSMSSSLQPRNPDW